MLWNLQKRDFPELFDLGEMESLDFRLKAKKKAMPASNARTGVREQMQKLDIAYYPGSLG